MKSIWQIYWSYARAPVFHRQELVSLQWLRGIAALMVVALHVEDVANTVPSFSGLTTIWSRFGYTGPDLFFVISGFIMCYVTFGMRFEPRRWMKRRFIRIYPVYIIFTMLAFIIWLIDPSMTMGAGAQDAGTIAKSFLIFPQPGLPMVFVGWTIEHEIIFYAIVFLVATVGYGVRVLTAVLGALSVLAILRWFLKDSYPALDFWDYHLLSLFMVQFLIGALVYLFQNALRTLGKVLPFVVAFIFFLAGGVLPEPDTINAETLPRVLVFGIAYGFLLVGALNWEYACREKKQGKPPLKRGLMVKIGDASYSLYLSHPFFLSVCGKLLNAFSFNSPTVVFGIFCAAIGAVGFGLAFHTLVEKPLLQIMRKEKAWNIF